MKLTPAQVKNLMRRGLRFLIDPEPFPEERQRCIAFFDHRCAYCGADIEKGRGDLDHLLSSALGGRNHISNRVFSCKPCNAEEKRDKPWEGFLVEKNGTGTAMRGRRRKILKWISLAGAVPPLSKATLRSLREEAEKATAVYDSACRIVRGVQPGAPADGPRARCSARG